MSHILWLLVHHRPRVADLIAAADPELVDEPVRASVARLLSGEPVAAIIEGTSEPGLKRTLQAVVARQELYSDEQAAMGAMEILGRRLEGNLSRELARTQEALASAERSGDAKAFVGLLEGQKAVRSRKRLLQNALATRNIAEMAAFIAAPPPNPSPAVGDQAPDPSTEPS